jgi:hypothetical protein
MLPKMLWGDWSTEPSGLPTGVAGQAVRRGTPRDRLCGFPPIGHDPCRPEQIPGVFSPLRYKLPVATYLCFGLAGRP